MWWGAHWCKSPVACLWPVGCQLNNPVLQLLSFTRLPFGLKEKENTTVAIQALFSPGNSFCQGVCWGGWVTNAYMSTPLYVYPYFNSQKSVIFTKKIHISHTRSNRGLTDCWLRLWQRCKKRREVRGGKIVSPYF